MSHKAFYQTFFQTEQLFRRADDVGSFPVRPDSKANMPAALVELQPTAVPIADVPTVFILDPVAPVAVVEVGQFIPASELTHTSLAESVEVFIDVPEPIVSHAEPPELLIPVRPATPLVGQKVLILVDEDLLPDDWAFLEKILNAVNLEVSGVDLLNVHTTENVNFADLLAGKHIHHLFTFGVPFSRVNLDIMMDHYHPVRFEGVTFLLTDSLPAIAADIALKRKLWESLKKVFLWR